MVVNKYYMCWEHYVEATGADTATEISDADERFWMKQDETAFFMNPQRFVGLRRYMAGRLGKFAHRFGQYYQHALLWSPPRIKTREWMFIPFWRRTTSPPQIILNRRSSAVLPVAASHAFLFLLNGVLAPPI